MSRSDPDVDTSGATVGAGVLGRTARSAILAVSLRQSLRCHNSGKTASSGGHDWRESRSGIRSIAVSTRVTGLGGRRLIGRRTVPATRMKAKREHRVPLLCRRAVEILDGAQMLGGGSPLVFAHGGEKPLYGRQLRRKLQIAAVPHGFRSSFRDWAVERTNHPREAVGAALAHAARNQTEAAYALSGST